MRSPSLRALAFLHLRVGNLTFGGGDPTMAVLQREMVNRRHWLSAEQYGLAYGLARITPGTNLLAFCAAAGWYLQGWRGAAATVLAVTLPSALLVVILTHAYQVWRGSTLAAGVIAGTVAAAVGMMMAGAWLLVRPHLGKRRFLRTTVFVAGAALLSFCSWLSPIQVLALAALAGFLWRGSDPA
jgi:chromate transporter